MNIPNSLHDMLEKLYGVRTTEVESEVVSGLFAAPVRILPSNPRRLSITIINMSGNVVFVGPRSNVSNTRGIWLAGNGGAVTLTWDKDFSLCSHDWYAISGAGGDAIYVVEVLSQ